VLIAYLIFFIKTVLTLLGNLLKRGKRPPDYVVFTLHGSYPDLPDPPEGFLQRKMKGRVKSLQELEKELRLIASSTRVKGVIFHIGTLALPFSRLQALIGMFQHLQESQKEVITWATTYSTSSYYLATAADRALLQKGGVVYTLGLELKQLYMKKALDWAGIKFDVIQITPYKSALERFMRSDMSEEVQSMMTWLLDSQFQEVKAAIMKGRNMDEEKTRALIEGTPYQDQQAVEQEAVDGIVNAEDLPEYLGDEGQPARLASWDQCRGVFSRPLPPQPGRYIAILRVQGNIVDGKSQRPPGRRPVPIPFLFNEQTGDISFVHQARQVLRDKRARAVLLYIDSGGGSAVSSEAMSAILEKIAAKKPLVAMMGSIAASGGYYVATPAPYIVAQPSTITGSIGVISARVVDSQLLDKLLLNRESIRRGQRDLFGTSEEPFSEEERDKAWNFIKTTYDIFLDRVTRSRRMSTAEVDEVGGGRVWTGKQALEHGLIDELGGLETALSRLRQEASLPRNTPLVEIPLAKKYLAPLPSPTSWLDLALDNLDQIQKSQALLAGPLYFQEAPDRRQRDLN